MNRFLYKNHSESRGHFICGNLDLILRTCLAQVLHYVRTCCLLFNSRVILAPPAQTSHQQGVNAGIQAFNLPVWMPADSCGG